MPDKVSDLVGFKSEEQDRSARPISTLKDPSTFAPPPKHRSVSGGEIDETSGNTTRAYPSLPDRTTTHVEATGRKPPPPPVPPRLPPRPEKGENNSLPVHQPVTDEDVKERGGLSQTATSALGRLGMSGISVPGFGTKSSTDKSSAIPPPAKNQTSMGFLVNRATSSSKDPTPAAGTSFAEKKAAAQTANQLYKDPTKVSFSDARAAASTARNFQQRHGEQVATGIRVANKYGLVSNETSVGARQSPPPPPPPRTVPSPSPYPYHRESAKEVSVSTPVKKPPPPLPPKRRAVQASPAEETSEPPMIPASTRPPPVPRSSRPAIVTQPPHPITKSPYGGDTSLPNSGLPYNIIPLIPTDLELCLETEWFICNPLKLPASIQDNPQKSFQYTNSWERLPSGRTRHTLIIAIMWTLNLSQTKVRLSWDASAPAATVKAQQRHSPPPIPLSEHQLEELADRNGPEIIGWCENRIGEKVGNGECWTLAHGALEATPGVMASQQASHGACIFSHYPPSAPNFTRRADIRIGDVLQFWKAKWVFSGDGWKTAGNPDHTSVVIGARKELGREDAWTIQVLEQNVGGLKIVQRGEYEIGSDMGMSQGGVRVFRPVYGDWLDLSTDWSDK